MGESVVINLRRTKGPSPILKKYRFLFNDLNTMTTLTTKKNSDNDAVFGKENVPKNAANIQSLGAFAAFVRENYLEEFVTEELKNLRSKDIPLMKLFTHLSDEQLRQMTVVSLTKFLTDLVEGTAYEEAVESLRKWEADELPGIPKNAIHPSDLVLVYYIQKVALLNFLPNFTSRADEVVHIMLELEDYYSKVQDDAIQLLFKLQKGAEKEVRLRESQLREAQELALIGSYDWEIGSETAICSPEMLRILGREGDTVLSTKELWDPIPDGEKGRVADAVQNSIETLSPYECEYPIATQDGTIKTVKARGKVIVGVDGKPTRMVGTIQDITSQKKSEESILRKSQELERSNEDLQRFASVASHDLKEPLRKIHTFADMLSENLNTDPNEESKDYVQRILTSCGRMERAIEDLLLYSKAGVEKENFARVDLNKVIEEIQEDYEVIIRHKKATIQVHKLPPIFAARSQMRQLFQNLISNALKFSNPDASPVIEIGCNDAETGWLNIFIKDNGIGFDEKYSKQIFEVFQRLHSKDEYEGSGIGLSICKKIVEKHKGEITVKSKLKEGTTFTIKLPTDNK